MNDYTVEIHFKNGDKRYKHVMNLAGYLKELYTYGWYNEAAGLAYPPHMIEKVTFSKQERVTRKQRDEQIVKLREAWDKLPHYLRDPDQNPYFIQLSTEDPLDVHERKLISNPAGYHEIKEGDSPTRLTWD